MIMFLHILSPIEPPISSLNYSRIHSQYTKYKHTGGGGRIVIKHHNKHRHDHPRQRDLKEISAHIAIIKHMGARTHKRKKENQQVRKSKGEE